MTQSASSHRPSFDQSRLYWSIWAVVAAFGTYFCMYAFRTPFTAANFSDARVLGLSLKTVLVVSQVAGYMASKIIGIKVIAELSPQRRAPGILVLIIVAQVTLLFFGLIPAPWNAICLFFNGLALGMVFGLVLGFLEGRQATEALAAGLCASFILADGTTKSVGTWLLAKGVSEFWMPCIAGLLFLPPVGLGAWMLSHVPPPSTDDIAARTARAQLCREERWSLLARYATGLTLLVVMYLAVTILRRIRSDFAPEIWKGLGEAVRPEIFTYSETIVAFGVLLVNGLSVLIRDNRRAFFTSLLTCGAGFVLIAVALLGRQFSILDSFGFMVVVGLGLYLPYVAMHTTIFERLLAMTRDRGNIGFLMYVADSVGYFGYVAVLLLHEFGRQSIADYLQFFAVACWVACALSFICLALTWRYFAVRCPAPKVVELAEAAA